MSSTSAFPYYRLGQGVDEDLLLHHRNGSLFLVHDRSLMPSGKVEWDYYVPFFDFTKQKAADAYLKSARNTLSEARGVIDGVFADSSGDARVSGTGNWHLNQTDEFIQVRSCVLLSNLKKKHAPANIHFQYNG